VIWNRSARKNIIACIRTIAAIPLMDIFICSSSSISGVENTSAINGSIIGYVMLGRLAGDFVFNTISKK
jgi:hypothetical protein